MKINFDCRPAHCIRDMHLWDYLGKKVHIIKYVKVATLTPIGDHKCIERNP